MRSAAAFPSSSPPVALADLLAALRIDLGDPEGALLDDPALERAVRKAVFLVAKDLAITLSLVASEIVPGPPPETEELILLLAEIHACQMMRARTANAFSFSSGDKRVDKTSQPEQWAKLEADLLATYRRRLSEIRGGGDAGDDTILRPRGLSPLVYERGVDVDPPLCE